MSSGLRNTLVSPRGLRFFAAVLFVACSFRILVADESKPVETVPEASAAIEGPQSSESIREVIPPTRSDQLDLETVWHLAGIRNPGINRARALVGEAQAIERRAGFVWFPDLSAGANYRKHLGVYQSSFGQIRDVSMSSAYVGAGSFAVGGNSPVVPGVRLTTHLADALFEPSAARQLTASRAFDVRATRNTTFLESTIAYLELLSAEHRLRAATQTYADAESIVATTGDFAQTGQGRAGDSHRAQAEGFLLLVELHRLEEELGVRAAELSRGLNLDPSIRLQTVGGPLQTYDLVDLKVGVPTLVAVAERSRPELASRGMLVAQSQIRTQQEKARPFLPMVTAGYSAGGFGGTGDFTPAVRPFTALDNRADFDVWAFWTLRNLGTGNKALVERFEAETSRRAGERRQTRDQIRNEVAEAYAAAYTRRLQVAPAVSRWEDAEQAFRSDYTRLRGGEGLPLESLNSVRLLAAARQELITVAVADTMAQFRLFVALGQPPTCSHFPASATSILPDSQLPEMSRPSSPTTK